MGKVRIKEFDQGSNDKQAEKRKNKKEEKKRLKTPGSKGGETVISVGPSEAELEKQADAAQEEIKSREAGSASGRKKAKFAKVRIKGKKYKDNSALINRETKYPLEKAVDILKKFKTSKFDETVELHINVKEKGVSGQISLPYGTGKKVVVKIVDDALLAEIEKGKISFDALVATPDMMPKLAKVARILGPKGLMPNPKAGTISDKPEDVVKKLQMGQINYKTEASAPIIHMTVGKVSFEGKMLEENIKMVLNSVGTTRLVSVTLKSTMSPAIRVQV